MIVLVLAVAGLGGICSRDGKRQEKAAAT